MKIIVNNLAIEYEDQGSGPVVLLLHGWKDDLHTFDALVSRLVGSYRVIRLDLPGFGNSERPHTAWTLDDYVRLVKNFMEKTQISADALIGHSFGGRILLKGLGSHELKTKKAILIASAGVSESHAGRGTLLAFVAKVGNLITYIPPLYFWRAELRQKFYRWIGSDYDDAGPMKEIFLNVVREDLGRSANTVPVPTLLIWGEADTQTPLADGKRLCDLIPESRLVTISDAGHFVHQEKPDEVARVIMEFLL